MSSRGYLFWARTDAEGRFELRNVRPGTYTLFVSGADQPDDLRRDAAVVVTAGGTTDLGTVAWRPVSHGRTLWQVGTFDRGTHEFRDGSNPRNYETFLNYFRDFPEDVTFTIGTSRAASDWYYAQWSWFNRSPVWTVRFDVDGPVAGKGTLTLGLASQQLVGELRVKVNGREVARLSRPTKSGGAGYRSGSQDSRYEVARVTFDASLLKPGTNELTVGDTGAIPVPDAEQRREQKRPPGAIMYDAIRLEVGE
jgi:rhamnogalacturonan endolyase